jgi:diguanylate cyclase (GGDEF)-like protein
MNTTNLSLEENLRRLKTQYATQLPGKITAIMDDWKKIKETWREGTWGKATWEQETLTLLHRNIHSLIGSSGTFGFTALSLQARALETALKPFIKAPPKDENLSDIYQLIEDKLQGLLDLTVEITGEIPELISIVEKEKKDAHSDFIDITSSKDISSFFDSTVIYYLDSDLNASTSLIENLTAYGFTIEHFTEPMGLLEKIREVTPSLVMLNLFLSDYSEAWIFNLSKQLSEKNIKVFILSEKNDFDYRLSAVRASANSYIVKPVDVPALVNSIRSELNINTARPPYILLVDDQPSILDYYSNVLAASGMKVDVSDNPLDVLDRMEKYRPDLIVLDINMPVVRGPELAAVIRQFPEYHSIPILFFSSDMQSEQKTELLEIGSDDLLQKGMPIAELVGQIKSRVERAKILSSFMYEDSLTGLLNHAQIQLAAEKHFMTAKRHKRKACIVMIDLDNFKSVNDTWGHQTGDKVIKAFSQLCQQRLRFSDIIGRYGGEEFMLVLPETDISDAGNLINELRKAFYNLEFIEREVSFRVSFSTGIAESTHCESVTDQIRKADEALYRAKNGGKNKVCLHVN